jgi:hypothetical protein
MHRIIRNINSTKPRKIAIKARTKSHALSQGGKACPDVSAYNTRTNQLFFIFSRSFPSSLTTLRFSPKICVTKQNARDKGKKRKRKKTILSLNTQTRSPYLIIHCRSSECTHCSMVPPSVMR